MEYYVDVILPIPLERSFTYRLNASEASFLKKGMRVAVPFGKSKIYTGIVQEVHSVPPEAYDAKEIHEIIDEHPLVLPVQTRHWGWIADYYMCTLGEVVRTALPSAFLLESETLILKNPDAAINEMELKDDEFLVWEALHNQSALKINDIIEITGKKSILPLLHILLQKQAIQLKERLVEQYRPKLVRYIKLAKAYETEEALRKLLDDLHRAPKQSEVVLSLFQIRGRTKKPIKTTTLEKESKASRAVIKMLIDKGILEEYFLRADRVTLSGKGNADLKDLNTEQLEALSQIRRSIEEKKVCLLQGVTSSGKTEVYAQLIAETLVAGKQVLYLLPEIALTTQLIQRLSKYFGSSLSVYHSKYSMNERVEVWNNVLHRRQKAQLVVGARSALFLPFSDLGLIIIDEEHDGSYKQFDPAPRYHARDAAIVLGNLHDCAVLLGTATPSIESFYNVKTEKYGHARMERRYGNVLMPDIELVDLKEQQRKRRMKGHFSERLMEAITDTLSEGEQVILFQNRRGYAPIVECTTCGHSPQCPNCDVSLTFHKNRNQLRCHYCGHHVQFEPDCPACGSFSLDTKGFGTEQVERELAELFPEATVGRMDLDTTRGKHAYQKIIHAFEQREMDILVGTQMVTKGLDFRNVNLVGIMNADTLLNFPDYKAHERCFQLLTQVAGRAGRTKKRGKVIIQTYNPYHQILKQVSTGDYQGMFNEQLYERELYRYPPKNRLIRITFRHKDYNKLNEASSWFAKALRNSLRSEVLGPEYPPVARIRNQYIKNVLLKISRQQSLAKTKNSIKRIEKSFNAISQYRSVRVIYNVDHF